MYHFGAFSYEFIRSKELISDSINDPITSDLSKNDKAIFDLLDRAQKYSKAEIAAQIGISQATVQRAIKKLTDKGLIKRVGSSELLMTEVTSFVLS